MAPKRKAAETGDYTPRVSQPFHEADTSCVSAPVPNPKKSRTTTKQQSEDAPVKDTKHSALKKTAKTAKQEDIRKAAAGKPKEQPVSLPERYVGKFDLYSTQLPFLVREYLPEGADKPDFYRLYKKILFYQAKPDFSMRIALDSADSDVAKSGRFSCSQVAEPMGDEEIKPILITDGQAKTVTFNVGQTGHRSTAGSVPGYSARLELGDEGHGCMISSGRGQFKMRRVWQGEHVGNAVELFEGYWDFHTVWSGLLSRKGFGRGEDYSSAFWGVRARKDADGNEIGIESTLR